jgi:hypothetical protein
MSYEACIDILKEWEMKAESFAFHFVTMRLISSCIVLASHVADHHTASLGRIIDV